MAVVPLTDSNDTLDLRNAPIDPTRRVVARGGNDTIYGTNEYDVIYADYASTSNAWRQPVTGIEGNDTVYGGGGRDFIYGEGGNDWLYGGDDNDVILGGSGHDVIYGDAGDDLLSGEDGNDTLLGLRGSDQLSGGAGNDTLMGYGGVDRREIDQMTGGTGQDEFQLGWRMSDGRSGIYYSSYGIEDYAVINDFARGNDKIRIGGSFNDYTLETRYNYAGGSAADTAIFYRGDLVAVVADTTTAVTLDTTCFVL